MEIFIVILLLSIAVGLVILEVFFLPGTTFAGIAGVIFAIVGIWYAYMQLGNTWGNISLIGSALVFGGAFTWLVRSNALNKVALNEEIDSKVESICQEKIKPGDEGITISRVNPIGEARINGETIEVKSNGEFIDPEVKIVVLKVYSTNVLVEVKKD
ncbi:MAG: hypothetical protein LUG18_04430 [Candidatus Azobacteroides sp.]|nr:hypothetical protein [Candidatus Azobacteroides sp.]